MHRKIMNFIKYNNAFTIIFVLCFFGFGISFAASPELRENVYSSKETVISVDNSLLVAADLDNFNFNLKIKSITEDEKKYYVAYSYQTLTIENSFWQNKEIEKTLKMNKEALDGKDLGLYVAEELGENINYELSYLKKIQKSEKEKGQSPKVVAVEYSGLIGKLLNPKEKVMEGYIPVIPEIVEEVPATIESKPEEVIVSTPYKEPKETAKEELSLPLAELPQESTQALLPEADGVSLTPSTLSEGEVETPEITPDAAVVPAETSLPAPEEMVDKELVQEVVKELLQNVASSTPARESATSSELTR